MAAANASYFLNFEKLKKTYNSNCVQDNCILTTAILIFSTSGNSVKLLSILHGAGGRQKSKMAVKEEVLISQQVYNIAA